jgi:hypothetical protein
VPVLAHRTVRDATSDAMSDASSNARLDCLEGIIEVPL